MNKGKGIYFAQNSGVNTDHQDEKEEQKEICPKCGGEVGESKIPTGFCSTKVVKRCRKCFAVISAPAGRIGFGVM